jgi:hypothetical protein
MRRRDRMLRLMPLVKNAKRKHDIKEGRNNGIINDQIKSQRSA